MRTKTPKFKVGDIVVVQDPYPDEEGWGRTTAIVGLNDTARYPIKGDVDEHGFSWFLSTSEVRLATDEEILLYKLTL